MDDDIVGGAVDEIGQLVAQDVGQLVRGPDSHSAVGADLDHASAGLQVALMAQLGRESVVDDSVGRRERRTRVSPHVVAVATNVDGARWDAWVKPDVRPRVRVEDGSARLHRFKGIEGR